jgi:uncharacterized protein YukE
VAAAAESLGRAKGDRASIKRKIVSIAYRKGASYVDRLPEDWKKKADMKHASVFAKWMDNARKLFRTSQDAAEMSNNDLMSRLLDELQEVEAGVLYVEAFHPVTDPTHVVYCGLEVPGEYADLQRSQMGYEPFVPCETAMYERSFTLDANGVVTLGTTRVEVQKVSKYEPVEGAEPEVLAKSTGEPPAVKNAELGAPCSCKTHKEAPVTLSGEEKNMDEKQAAEFLAKATPEQLKALGVAKVEEKKEEVKVAAVAAVVADAPKVLTFAEILATASPEVQDSINAGLKVAAAAKADVIKALKDSGRCSFTDEQLNAKSQVELDALKQLAGIKAASHVVDYGGMGARSVGSQTEVPAPPDLGEHIRAARAKSDKR